MLGPIVQLPRILIIGRQGTGKSTLGNYLAAQNESWRSVAVSDVIIEWFAGRLGATEEAIKASKKHYRPALIRLTEELTTTNPGFFVRNALQRANVVNGVRRNEEFEVVRLWFDLTVHIFRCPTLEDGPDNYNISREMAESCHFQVRNDGDDLRFLERIAQSISQRLR